MPVRLGLSEYGRISYDLVLAPLAPSLTVGRKPAMAPSYAVVLSAPVVLYHKTRAANAKMD